MAVIVIVDYGAGNLHSVAKALAWLGCEAKVTSSPEEVLQAQAVVFPGVGAAGNAMQSLQQSGLVPALRQVVAEGRPFLGICLGLQLLLPFTEEGDVPCLGLVPGRVKRLPPGLKVPHMGWNQVRQVKPHPLFAGIPDGTNFYFVHSYYAAPDDSSLVTGETEYGVHFPSVLSRDNLTGTQFHPEKSGTWGLRVYENFLKQAGVK